MPPAQLNHAKMGATGLLIVSNVKNISKILSSVGEYVKSVLYVDLNLLPKKSPPQWSRTITDIYLHSMQKCPNVDVRVLVSSVKADVSRTLCKDIDVLLFDQKTPGVLEKVQNRYMIKNLPTYLPHDTIDLDQIEIKTDNSDNNTVYDNVVLGGTFDRLHSGHKILLSEAVLRARKRVVVGITAPVMLSSKKLFELILPLQKRIQEVREFLDDVDSTLNYEIVSIEDPMGPTRTDPSMDLLIVSPETLRSGQKINDARVENGLNKLDIYSIDLLEADLHDDDKELKVSSSNYRMDILGTRLQTPEPRPNLSKSPYIIGLTGGIASGKSIMASRFEKLGAKIIYCDQLAHQIYEPGTQCYEKLVQHFGDTIVAADDTKINRKILGQIVFGDSNKLKELNEIVWPELLVEVKKLIKQYQTENCKVVIIEAAVLLQAGWERECHEVWSMIISPDEAVRRLKERNGLTEEEAMKRISSQLDNTQIVRSSDIVFSSQWSMDCSERQAHRAWNVLSEELKL